MLLMKPFLLWFFVVSVCLSQSASYYSPFPEFDQPTAAAASMMQQEQQRQQQHEENEEPFSTLNLILFPKAQSPDRRNSLTVNNPHNFSLYVAIYPFELTRNSNLPTLPQNPNEKLSILTWNEELNAFKIYFNEDNDDEEQHINSSHQVANFELSPLESFVYTDYGNMEGSYHVFIQSIDQDHRNSFQIDMSYPKGEFRHLPVEKYQIAVVLRWICYVLTTISIGLLVLILISTEEVGFGQGLISMGFTLFLNELYACWMRFLNHTKTQTKADDSFKKWVVKMHCLVIVSYLLAGVVVLRKSQSSFPSKYNTYIVLLFTKILVVALILLATLYKPSLYQTLDWFNHHRLHQITMTIQTNVFDGFVFSYVLQEYLPFLNNYLVFNRNNDNNNNNQDESADEIDLELRDAFIWSHSIKPAICEIIILVKVLSTETIIGGIMRKLMEPDFFMTGPGCDYAELIRSKELTNQFLRLELPFCLLRARGFVWESLRCGLIAGSFLWFGLQNYCKISQSNSTLTSNVQERIENE